MNTKRILFHSVATLIALTPFVSRGAQRSITAAGNPTLNAGNPAWGTAANWSPATIPGTSDNAAITYAGSAASAVDIRASGIPGGATNIQDLSFIGTGSGAVTLENNSTSTSMVLTLNGGRGAGVPLIQSGAYAVTIAGVGPGTTQTLRITLAASGEINPGAGGLMISAVIDQAGTRSINKTGANRLTLSGANTYTGGTTVSGGTLVLGNATDTLSNFGKVTVNGGTLDIGANSDTVQQVTLISGSITGTTGVLTSGFTYDVQSGTIGAKLAGSSFLSKSTAGTVTLSGANTYTGSTSVSEGTLALTDNLALQNSTLFTSGAGTLDLTGVNSPTFGGLSAGITGLDLVLPGNVTNLTLKPQSGRVVTYSKNLSGAAGLIKSGTGTQVLSGANTYTGQTTVNGGILSLTGANAYPGFTVVNNSGTLLARNANALAGSGNSVTVATGGTFNYAALADAPLSVGGALAITGGTGTAIGGSMGSTTTSAAINVSGAATASGAVAVNLYAMSGLASGTYKLLQGGAGSSVDGATYSLGKVYNNVNWTASALTASATDLQVSISSATALATAYWKGGLTGGTDVWAASNGTSASNWTATAVGAAQALVPGSGANVFISATAPTTAPTATVLGADMSIQSVTIADATNGLGLNNDGNTLTIGAGGITMNASVPSSTINAKLALGADQTWINNSYAELTVFGAVSGTGNLVKAGTGTLNLFGANSFTGGITVNGGGLSVLSSDSSLGNTANGVTLGAGGTLRFVSAVTLAAARVITVNGNAGSPSGLNLGTGATQIIGDSQLTGSGTVQISSNLGFITSILSVEGVNAGFTGDLRVGAPGQLVGQSFSSRSFSTSDGIILRLQNAGTLAGATSLTVNNGSALNITQPTVAVTGCLGTTMPLTFHSGRFQYNPSANGGTAINDTFGSVGVTGQLSITGSSTAGPATGTTLNFGALTRTDHATLLFRAPQSGTQGTFGGSAAATSVGVFFANLTPDTTTSGTTRSVVPWAGNATSVGSTDPQNFMTYDANGFRPLNTTTEIVALAVNGLADVAAGVNVRTGSDQQIAVVGQTINSFSSSTSFTELTGSATAGAPGDVLAVTSGAMSASSTLMLTNATVNFPSGGYFHLGSAFAITTNSRLTGTGGIAATSRDAGSSYELRFTNTPDGGNTFTGGLYANGNAAITFTLNNQLGNDGSGQAAGDLVLGGGQLLYNPAAAATVGLNDGTNKRAIKVNESNGTIGTGVAGAVLQIPGTISGAGQVQFGGGTSSNATGVVELTNTSANTFTGGSLISTGILRLANANQLGTGPILLNGGTLQAAANLTFTTTPILVASSSIDTQGFDITLSGGFDGSGGTSGSSAPSLSLTKAGAGKLTLAGTSTHAGAVNVSGGALNISADAALGATTGTLTLSNTAALQLGAATALARPVVLGAGGGGTIDTNGFDLSLTTASNMTGTTLTKAGAGTLTISGTQGYSALVTNGGTTTLNSALGTGASTVTASAATNFGVKQKLASLTVNNTGLVTLTAHTGGPANITPIDTSALAITGGGKLDLTNNALIVRSSTLAAVNAKITTGYNAATGYWNGPGINSSTAALDPTGLTAIGVLNNAEYGYTTFAGITGLVGTEILVKYTWYGDTDLNGVVNADDFSQFAAGFTGAAPAEWFNGDFDYNGVVNGDDFSLFAAGLTGQTGQLREADAALVSAELALLGAASAAPVAGHAAVPEPGTLASLIGGFGLLLGLRRARRPA